MRKRLRKKKHLREFQEFGIELEIQLRNGTDFDTFLDAFIEAAVEANGLQCGVGGKELELSGVIELGRRGIYQSNRENVEAWLQTQSAVQSFRFGNLEDAWYPQTC